MKLTTLAEATLVVAFLVTLWPRAGARVTRSYLTPVVGTLAVIALDILAPHVTPFWGFILQMVARVGLLFQPFFLMRLVSVLQPVSRRRLRALGIGTAVVALAVVATAGLPAGFRIPVLWAAILGMIVAEAYGTWRLWRGGARSFGAARQRAYMLALASALVTLLLLADVVAGVADVVAGLDHVVIPATLMSVGLAVMSLQYVLAGASPLWLRHAWQMPVLYRYYEAEQSGEDPAEPAIVERLVSLAMLVVDAVGGEVLVRGAEGEGFSSAGTWGQVPRQERDSTESTSDDEALERVWQSGMVEAVQLDRRLAWWTQDDDRLSVRRVIVLPVRAGTDTLMMLRLYSPVHGLFLQDDLLMLEALAAYAGSRVLNARAWARDRAVANTLREANRALEAASTAKSDFLSGMSHEFRTPLNAIIGFSDLMLQSTAPGLPERYQRYAANILESGQHLLQIVNDVLDIAKADASRLEIRLTPVNLARVVDAALLLVRPQAAAGGITLVNEADGEATLWADELRARQVLLNLLSNAVKFTPAGGRVQISSQRHDDRVEVVVEDTGIGIDAAHLTTVFDEFVQVSHGTDRAYEGTGLGLPLVRRLTAAMGGGVRADSTPGVGSVFTVWFPVPPGPARASELPTGAPRMTDVAVLVVDDDRMVREYCWQVLSDAGYEVQVVGGVDAAREAIAASPPHLILLDLLLDGESGEEVLQTIESLNPRPRVLVMSIVDPDHRPLAGAVAGWLVKPVRADRLRAAVAQVLAEGPAGQPTEVERDA
ncbi:MAG: ATP-binding protein [Thermaerobacter sp.]|nr:ATP-binding protein [Thermaerobacter sp.]